MSHVTHAARIATIAAGVVAAAASSVVIATAAPAAPGSERFTPLADGSHTEFLVNPVVTQDDLLYTDKDITTMPGVRAHSIDGRSYSFYRVVDGVRIGMARISEFCLPTGACHGIIVDAPKLP
ncbi:hypothetical protein ACFWPA_07140 [Rhodococcus sp. NPDC058505]|uniref:hypothetical protein n=1 Tax=unclassified Rhodococcus (in: high G+C Gram-positive bacteria) TaxID=192944 RepID=UPI00365E82BB